MHIKRSCRTVTLYFKASPLPPHLKIRQAVQVILDSTLPFWKQLEKTRSTVRTSKGKLLKGKAWRLLLYKHHWEQMKPMLGPYFNLVWRAWGMPCCWTNLICVGDGDAFLFMQVFSCFLSPSPQSNCPQRVRFMKVRKDTKLPTPCYFISNSVAKIKHNTASYLF